MSHELTAVEIGNNFPYVSWIIRHSQELMCMVSEIQICVNAPTLEEKWESAKKIGDVLIPALKDLPGLTSTIEGVITLHPIFHGAASGNEIAALCATPEFQANGELIKKLIAAWPQILQVIQMILVFIPKTPVTA